MKVMSAVTAGAAALMLIAWSAGASAQQSKMKSCADEWNKMKAANQTAGKTYRDFSKECMSRGDDSASATKPAATPASTPAAQPAKPATQTAAKPATSKTDSSTTAKPMSAGRQAMVERERACGAEWKSDKDAGKVAAGMTWPKYWSDCNKRKKAAGM